MDVWVGSFFNSWVLGLQAGTTKPSWWWTGNIFSCAYWSFVNLLWRNIYSYLSLLFKIGLFDFIIEFFTYLDIRPSSNILFTNIFSHFVCWVPFPFLDRIRWNMKVLKLYCYPIYATCTFVLYLRKHCSFHSHKDLPLGFLLRVL